MGFFDKIKGFFGKKKGGNNSWDNIKCPYCFNTFAHDKVYFRSETFFTPDAIGTMHMNYEREENAEKKKALALSIENAKHYELCHDNVYGDFWRRMVGDENYENDSYSRNPVLTVDEASECIYDEDGFLVSIRDGAGVITERRICPYCHNILPRFYGKYETKFLSIVGITASGKTVYLSQLINNLEDDLVKVGCSAIFSTEANEFRKNYTVKKGLPLPVGTVVRFVAPLFFTIQGKSNITLVAYDIAGEACVDVEKMSVYGAFIKNSDGILMLVDPGQFKGLHAALRENSEQMITEDEKASPTAVLSAVHGAFMGGSKSASDIPLAVTISKSDMLLEITDASNETIIPYNSNIRRDVVALPDRSFNYMDYKNVNADITIMVSNQFPALHATVTRNFSNYGYFAVSALGCAVEPLNGSGDSWTPVTDPMPLRIEEPLCWLLKEWNIIN